jgi:hypothetical protein
LPTTLFRFQAPPFRSNHRLNGFENRIKALKALLEHPEASTFSPKGSVRVEEKLRLKVSEAGLPKPKAERSKELAALRDGCPPLGKLKRGFSLVSKGKLRL